MKKLIQPLLLAALAGTLASAYGQQHEANHAPDQDSNRASASCCEHMDHGREQATDHSNAAAGHGAAHSGHAAEAAAGQGHPGHPGHGADSTTAGHGHHEQAGSGGHRTAPQTDSPGNRQQHSMGRSMNMSHQRHHLVMADGLDSAYRGRTNPLGDTAANLAAGAALYQQQCASCHGVEGDGNGSAAAGLNPAPTDIARFAAMPMAADDYLLWTLSEGGAPVGSAMPAFKATLSEEQLWQVVVHLRQLGKAHGSH